MNTKITITFEKTTEATAEAISVAGGRGTEEELNQFKNETRFSQAIVMTSSQMAIENYWSNGYRVVRVAPTS